MTVFVALARGVNVGGAHVLAMSAPRGLFERAGAVHVETLIQRGNVLFETEAGSGDAIAAAVRELISREFGFAPPFVTRDARRWRSILEENPYLSRDADTRVLHVACLSAAPAPGPRFAAPDKFEARDDTLYLRTPNGVARSKLTVTRLHRALGVVCTMRNWATAVRIGAALARREA